MNQPLDPYVVLGISRSAAIDEIRRAYRKVSRQTHPDAGGSHEHFLHIRAAYELLTDPAARRDYDRSSPVHANVGNVRRPPPTHGEHLCAVAECHRHHVLGGAHCWRHADAAERAAAVSASGRVRCVFVNERNEPCGTVLSAETLVSGIPHVCWWHGAFLFDQVNEAVAEPGADARRDGRSTPP